MEDRSDTESNIVSSFESSYISESSRVRGSFDKSDGKEKGKAMSLTNKIDIVYSGIDSERESEKIGF